MVTNRAERIKFLIDQSQKSYQELEKITGIKKSSLQRYASGKTTKIPLDVIEKLSVAFGVTQEYLIGWEEKPPTHSNSLTEGEEQLINLFRQIPADQQGLVLQMIRVALDNLQ